MTPPTVSIIVASRHRPAALRRCLCALHQQDHREMEVIVVTDPATAAQLSLISDRVKLIPFDAANISAARNAGLGQAAGEVVAFIDDDAAAEPTWARRLSAPFADPRVGAATGFVRGRNGISFQWKAVTVDRFGEDTPLAVDEAAPSLHEGDAGRAVKTQGTNMAFRRDALLAIGGFDPALEFYLDEAHVDLSLASRGLLTAVVPGAQVHHGFAASERRRADRAPFDLQQIGASVAAFLRRHAPEADHAPPLSRLRAAQRGRLVAMMVDGRLSPPDVGRLMATLDAGIAEGAARVLPDLVPLPAPKAPFRALPGTGPRPGRILAGRPWARARLQAEAKAAAGDGAVVTVIRMGPSARRHRVRFDPGGFWEQTGGTFGKAERQGPRPPIASFAARVAREVAYISQFRPIGNPDAG